MKNLVVKKGIVLGVFFALVFGNVVAAEKDVVGVWNYEAPSAPYEYATGKLIFTENGEKLEGKIKIGEYEIEMKSLKVDGSKIEFGAYMEGEYISIKAEIKKNTLAGTANYSEGSMEVTGEKVK